MEFMMWHPQSSIHVLEFDLRDNGSMSCRTLNSKLDKCAMQARIDKTLLSVEEGVGKLASFLTCHPSLHRKILEMLFKGFSSDFGMHS
jgi:hypothetical protein